MDRKALTAIIYGATEMQKECRRHYTCCTCFFYTDKYKDTCCQLQAYIKNDIENIGKNLSLQYVQ